MYLLQPHSLHSALLMWPQLLYISKPKYRLGDLLVEQLLSVRNGNIELKVAHHFNSSSHSYTNPSVFSLLHFTARPNAKQRNSTSCWACIVSNSMVWTFNFAMLGNSYPYSLLSPSHPSKFSLSVFSKISLACYLVSFPSLICSIPAKHTHSTYRVS